jgi:AraC-like DNA-binding protein
MENSLLKPGYYRLHNSYAGKNISFSFTASWRPYVKSNGGELWVIGPADSPCTVSFIPQYNNSWAFALPPGSIKILFGFSAEELTNRALPWRELTASRFESTQTPTVAGIRKMLSDDTGGGNTVNRLLDIITQRQISTVKQLSELSGYSSRHLQRIMLEDIGLSPKTLLNILRFERSQTFVSRGGFAALASAGGYYDQSHMIKEYRKYAGLTPRALAGTSGFYNTAP